MQPLILDGDVLDQSVEVIVNGPVVSIARSVRPDGCLHTQRTFECRQATLADASCMTAQESSR
jgi:hypothetical protein